MAATQLPAWQPPVSSLSITQLLTELDRLSQQTLASNTLRDPASVARLFEVQDRIVGCAEADYKEWRNSAAITAKYGCALVVSEECLRYWTLRRDQMQSKIRDNNMRVEVQGLTMLPPIEVRRALDDMVREETARKLELTQQIANYRQALAALKDRRKWMADQVDNRKNLHTIGPMKSLLEGFEELASDWNERISVTQSFEIWSNLKTLLQAEEVTVKRLKLHDCKTQTNSALEVIERITTMRSRDKESKRSSLANHITNLSSVLESLQRDHERRQTQQEALWKDTRDQAYKMLEIEPNASQDLESLLKDKIVFQLAGIRPKFKNLPTGSSSTGSPSSNAPPRPSSPQTGSRAVDIYKSEHRDQRMTAGPPRTSGRPRQ